jgi:Kinetochore protein Sos7
MKWMYLEQETKEAYLRAILCDPPTVVEQKDNDELGICMHSISNVETRNVAAKAKLKARKKEVDELCAQVTALARQVGDGPPSKINSNLRVHRNIHPSN